ncbi:MAG TPA: polysaccharide deacetylase family protein [Candidatus Saccharimonadales bacterium]|nr:polysaccharide deacetylase family protein [Candidatus Saccharimonadales bacterium]
MTKHSHIQRKFLLTWIVLPIIIVWLTTNYLIGIFRSPAWLAEKNNTAIASGALAQTGEKPPTIAKYTWNNTGLVTLWFDDGWNSQYTTAYPILEEFGYKAALAVPTNLIGNDPYMGVAQVKKLQTNGWEMTSHTRNHNCRLFEANEQTLESELGGSKDDLKRMGLGSDNFVSPCGVDSLQMKTTAEKYYSSFRTSEPGFNPIPVEDPYNLVVQTMRVNVPFSTVQSWIYQARQQHKWLIIMFHQIDSSGTEYSITPSMLHDILGEIEKDQLPVVLPNQVLKIDNKPKNTTTSNLTKNITPTQ